MILGTSVLLFALSMHYEEALLTEGESKALARGIYAQF
jgi:hypothetical protein